MKEMRWGRIVNICSLAMKTGGLTAGTAYTASKGGMAALTFSLAREFAPFGITVNGISPAYIKTPMITDFLTTEQQRRLLEQIPVGRFCEPEEVANVVRFLCITPIRFHNRGNHRYQRRAANGLIGFGLLDVGYWMLDIQEYKNGKIWKHRISRIFPRHERVLLQRLGLIQIYHSTTGLGVMNRWKEI